MLGRRYVIFGQASWCSADAILYKGEPLSARPTLGTMDRFTNLFDLGGAHKEAAGGLGSPSTPPPAQQRRSNHNDSLEEYSFVSNQRSRSGAGPPTRAVEFTLPGNNNPRTNGVATESHSREGAEEGLYIEPAQFGQSPKGQGAASIFQPGLQPQPGGHQVQTTTGPNKPYSGFDEAFKRWGPSSERDATRDLKF